MIVFPPAKINLGLNVIGMRADGYRDIETVMLPIPWTDVLEVIVDTGIPAGRVEYTRSGLAMDGDHEQDLCMRATRAVSARYPLPGLRMHLHKAIPLGAGLGGGSSDAAHVIMLLDSLLDLGMTADEKHGLACGLGSDVPFFLLGTAAMATGRGEVLKPVEPHTGGWWLRVVNPGIHVPTAEVYAHTALSGIRCEPDLIVASGGPDTWGTHLRNAMEDHVFATRAEVGALKRAMETQGAAYTAMSGSGSTVFGFFKDRPPEHQWPVGYQAKDFRVE